MAGTVDSPRVVAIETTGRQGSTVLAAGDEIVAMARFAADLQHAAELLPTIDRLCTACTWHPEMIEEVYVSAGPGSFTGCRIGVTMARAMALAVGARLIRVPTTEVLAWNAIDLPDPPDHLVVILDAQRRQVYASLFHLEGRRYVCRQGVHVGEPGALLMALPKPCSALGEGIAYHRRALEGLDLNILPEPLWSARAENVLRVGRELARRGFYVAAGDLVPIYIRPPEAEERWQARWSSGGA